MLQALALESAGGYAEIIHERIRQIWGWPDPPSMTIKQLFHAGYQGIRLSFGFPACPDIEQQKKLFHLLPGAAKIGVNLTDEFMMDPEASVSALCFAHPDAKYFVL